MKKLQTLFLAWQDIHSRAWFTIGKLTYDGEQYQFVYTQGVKEAENKCNFQPLYSFPDLEKVYTSIYLFPIFANRLMSSSRPDYANFIQGLNIQPDEDDPLVILARSGGERKTDNLAVFPYPEVNENGQYQLYFFAHGLRHLPKSSIERINKFVSQETLWLAHEFQNPYHNKALILNTEDHHIVGYYPRYLCSEILDLILKNPRSVTVEVERVNLFPTPLQFRLLCHLTAVCEDDFQPFSSSEYQPLVLDSLVNVA